MDCTLTLTANAGVIVDSDICFTVDALHDEKSRVFSSLSPQMAQEVFRLTDARPPQAILISHEHIDHYSPVLNAQAQSRYPSAAFIFPARHSSGSDSYTGESFTVSWQRLPHAPIAGHGSVSNYAFLVEFAGRRVFTTGDADPAAPETLEYVDGLQPDLAILNFAWITKRSNRISLEKLGAKQLVLVHLPFPQDDRFGYIEATEQAVQNYRPDAVILNRFLQSADIVL